MFLWSSRSFLQSMLFCLNKGWPTFFLKAINSLQNNNWVSKCRNTNMKYVAINSFFFPFPEFVIWWQRFVRMMYVFNFVQTRNKTAFKLLSILCSFYAYKQETIDWVITNYTDNRQDHYFAIPFLLSYGIITYVFIMMSIEKKVLVLLSLHLCKRFTI